MYMKMVIYQCFSLYFTTPALPYFIPINKVPSFFIYVFYNETSIRKSKPIYESNHDCNYILLLWKISLTSDSIALLINVSLSKVVGVVCGFFMASSITLEVNVCKIMLFVEPLSTKGVTMP